MLANTSKYSKLEYKSDSSNFWKFRQNPLWSNSSMPLAVAFIIFLGGAAIHPLLHDMPNTSCLLGDVGVTDFER